MNTFGSERIDFAGQAVRVNDDAVSDYTTGFGPDRAAGQEVQGELRVTDDNGMACVCTAAVSDDEVGLFGENVDDFTFSFVAPLQSHDTGIHQKTPDSISGRFIGKDKPQ
jgi:hypothetical protein